jgi:hypothetical protein
MLSNMLNKLMDERILKCNLPSTAETTVRKASTGETVLTMIHYIHQRRTNTIDIIEDEIPLYDIDVDLYHPETISVIRVASLRMGLNAVLNLNKIRVHRISNLNNLSNLSFCEIIL